MQSSAQEQRDKASKRRWYQRNKVEQIKRITEKKESIRKYIISLKNKPCMDCGNTYSACAMDFDHRPGTTKVCDPSQLHRYGSWKKVRSELAKCDLICSNCHRVRTYHRLTSHKRAKTTETLH